MGTKHLEMKCREFKKISLLFIDKDLSEDIYASADSHLKSCQLCQEYLLNINSLYSQTNIVSEKQKTDPYFYTRLKARMDAESVIIKKPFQKVTYYLQPALYALIAFTLLLSVVTISSSIKNRQQTVSSTLTQSTNADEQDYMKTIAMNDQTFEEEYINIINK